MRIHRRLGALLVAAAVCCLLLPGCGGKANRLGIGRIAGYQSMVLPPPGLLYSDFKAPQRPAVGAVGSKKGTATVHSIGIPPNPWTGLLGWSLFSWGDASAETAKQSGGISEISHVDYDFRLILMIYRRYTTEVYGN